MDQFKQTNDDLRENATAVLQSAKSIRKLSLNTTISAHHFGEEGSTLKVIAESMGEFAIACQTLFLEASTQMKDLIPSFNALIFDVAATKLQSEIALEFINELSNHRTQETNSLSIESLDILVSQMRSRSGLVYTGLKSVEGKLRQLMKNLVRLGVSVRVAICTIRGQKRSRSFKRLDAVHRGV
ncbi:MAG: hypothetical protein R3C03_17030 [Pirellulaceae bacterium]